MYEKIEWRVGIAFDYVHVVANIFKSVFIKFCQKVTRLCTFIELTVFQLMIQEMWDEEKHHRETFERLIVERRVRPTVLLPLWNIAGYALGNLYTQIVFVVDLLSVIYLP